MATKIDRSAPPPQRSVPVRYAHLHYALGRGAEQNTNNQQEKKSTKSISGLDLSLGVAASRPGRGTAAHLQTRLPPPQRGTRRRGAGTGLPPWWRIRG